MGISKHPACQSTCWRLICCGPQSIWGARPCTTAHDHTLYAGELVHPAQPGCLEQGMRSPAKTIYVYAALLDWWTCTYPSIYQTLQAQLKSFTSCSGIAKIHPFFHNYIVLLLKLYLKPQHYSYIIHSIIICHTVHLLTTPYLNSLSILFSHPLRKVTAESLKSRVIWNLCEWVPSNRGWFTYVDNHSVL